MPGMTGVELAQQLILLRPDIPLILTSGYVNTQTRTERSRPASGTSSRSPLS